MHFAYGVLTPHATKGDARPLWISHWMVPAASCGECLDSIIENRAAVKANGGAAQCAIIRRSKDRIPTVRYSRSFLS